MSIKVDLSEHIELYKKQKKLELQELIKEIKSYE